MPCFALHLETNPAPTQPVHQSPPGFKCSHQTPDLLPWPQRPHPAPMPSREDLTDALIALIPEDGSRISNGEIKSALEREVGVPLSDAQVEEAKNLVVAMGAEEKARGPGGGLKAPGVEPPTEGGGTRPHWQRRLRQGAPGV
jgi:hypothetical protein